MTSADAMAICLQHEQCNDCPYCTIGQTEICLVCGSEIESSFDEYEDLPECLLEIDGVEPYLWPEPSKEQGSLF